MATSVTTKSYGTMSPIGGLQEFMRETEPLVAMFNEAVGMGTGLAQEGIDAVTNQGKAAGRAIRGQAEVEAMKQHQALEVGKALNVDEIVANAHGQRYEAQKLMDTLKPQIMADAAVTPWDDPLKWIVTQFTAPKTLEAYRLAADTDKQMSSRISQVQQDVAQQRAINFAPTANLVRNIADNQALAAEAEGLYKANDIAQRSNESFMRNLTVKIGLNSQMLNEQQETMRMISQQRIESMQAERFRISGLREDRAFDKQAEKEREEQVIYDSVSIKFAQIGKKPPPIELYKQMDAKTRSDLAMWASTVVIADGYGTTIKRLEDLDAVGSFKQVQPEASQFIEQALGSPSMKALAVTQEFKENKNFQNLSVTNQNATLLDRWQADAEKSAFSKDAITSKLPADNPYKLDFAKVTQWPELKDNSFAREVREQQATNPSKQWTEQDMLNMLTGRVRKAKEMNQQKDIPKLSAEFAEFFRQGSISQYAYSGMAVMGGKRPNSYGISTIDQPVQNINPKSGQPRVLQAWDPVEVQQFAMRIASSPRPTGFGTNQMFP